jgi:hypothetical protein
MAEDGVLDQVLAPISPSNSPPRSSQPTVAGRPPKPSGFDVDRGADRRIRPDRGRVIETHLDAAEALR